MDGANLVAEGDVIEDLAEDGPSEAEIVDDLQWFLLNRDDPDTQLAVFLTVRWAFGKARAMHEFAVFNLCRGVTEAANH